MGDNNMIGNYFLVIILIVTVWYGIMPIAGAYFSRYRWRQFRNRFNELRSSTLLDYRRYRQPGDENNNNIFCFTGGIESITDGRTLWVRGENLTIPVSLEKTKCYLLPLHEGTEPEKPEQIRWNQVSTLTEGVKVFIGGQIQTQNNRLSFGSTRENPLMVIFYNCPDDKLPYEIIYGARTNNEYWNSFTPISLIIGALALIYIAGSLLGRTAHYLTVIIALISIFIPILPILPPGILFTALYRRLSWNSKKIKAGWDLARFGILKNIPHPAVYRYNIKAYMTEAAAWLSLLLGIFVNVIFIFLLLYQFNVISF